MTSDSPDAVDVLKWPIAGAFLKRNRSRYLLQIPLLAISVLMVAHGLLGPALSPKNLATSLTWVYFRGVLVIVLLCAGNFFCTACPFVLVRDLARKLHTPRLNWPRPLRNKWLSLALFVAVLFIYEAFSLWASPWWTAWLIVAYFASILLIDLTFKHAAFCKFVCPIGQFNFLTAAFSPLELRVRKTETCDRCQTRDCIRGVRSEDNPLVTIQRGCELALFLPLKVGNMDCTFCLDCVHACPHDNIGILSRPPGEELLTDPQRSGVGHLLKRVDLGAFAALLAFGALMNAFGMVSPVYAFERWLSRVLHIGNQTAILAIVFALVLIVAPAILLGAAGVASTRWARMQNPFPRVVNRYSFSLVPLGFGMWLAHYSFHLLTGLYTAIPLTQSAVLNIFGTALLGGPQWTLVGLPVRIVQPIEYGLLALGLSGSLSLLYHYAREDGSGKWPRIFIPWAALNALLFAAGIWLMAQPMDMRATFLG